MKQADRAVSSQVSLLPYRRCIPQILVYQLVSKGIFTLVLFLYRQVTAFVLWNAGRPAMTSGDLPYMMASWEGWVLILCGFLLLVIYTVFDVNAAILMSDRLLRGKQIHVLPLLRDAFGALGKFRNLWGVLAILYVSLAAPLTGAVFGITLTSNFVIPNFITSVIRMTAILNLLYTSGVIALGIVGFLYVFTFDFAILGGEDVPEAMKSAKGVMKKNWKHFLLSYFLFLLKWLLVLAAGITVIYALPCIFIEKITLSLTMRRAGIIFFSILTAAFLAAFAVLATYYTQMKLTILYRAYSKKTAVAVAPKKTAYRKTITALVLAVLVFAVLIAAAGAEDFDKWYPAHGHAQVIAHRAGGNLANENTVRGLNAAWENGAYGAEIDVQRTKDGYYIVNHDNTFKRTCGDSRAPGDMTLAEVKQLEVADRANLFGSPAEVATLEDMLDAAKDRIRLYIELKGKSADRQMAEDVIKEAEKRDMEEQIVLISLDYELIDYIEKKHPAIETGYLCYFAFGSIEKMNCDDLLMEEEVATDSNIGKIHEAGKKAGVWTVNTSASMTGFLNSDVDFIITDEVTLAGRVRKLLGNRSDETRVLENWMRGIY